MFLEASGNLSGLQLSRGMTCPRDVLAAHRMGRMELPVLAPKSGGRVAPNFE
jgi:hypothetical protein